MLAFPSKMQYTIDIHLYKKGILCPRNQSVCFSRLFFHAIQSVAPSCLVRMQRERKTQKVMLTCWWIAISAAFVLSASMEEIHQTLSLPVDVFDVTHIEKGSRIEEEIRRTGVTIYER